MPSGSCTAEGLLGSRSSSARGLMFNQTICAETDNFNGHSWLHPANTLMLYDRKLVVNLLLTPARLAVVQVRRKSCFISLMCPAATDLEHRLFDDAHCIGLEMSLCSQGTTQCLMMPQSDCISRRIVIVLAGGLCNKADCPQTPVLQLAAARTAAATPCK